MDRRPPLPRPWRHGRRPRSAPPRAAPAMPTWWGGGLNQHAHRAPPCDPPSCAASIDARGRVGGTPGGWRGRDEPPGAVQKILSGAGIVCFAESSAASAAVGIEREPPPTLIADAAESAHTPTGAPRPRSRPGPNRGIAGWGGVDGQRRRPRREGKKKKRGPPAAQQRGRVRRRRSRARAAESTRRRAHGAEDPRAGRCAGPAAAADKRTHEPQTVPSAQASHDPACHRRLAAAAGARGELLQQRPLLQQHASTRGASHVNDGAAFGSPRRDFWRLGRTVQHSGLPSPSPAAVRGRGARRSTGPEHQRTWELRGRPSEACMGSTVLTPTGPANFRRRPRPVAARCCTPTTAFQQIATDPFQRPTLRSRTPTPAPVLWSCGHPPKNDRSDVHANSGGGPRGSRCTGTARWHGNCARAARPNGRARRRRPLHIGSFSVGRVCSRRRPRPWAATARPRRPRRAPRRPEWPPAPPTRRRPSAGAAAAASPAGPAASRATFRTSARSCGLPVRAPGQAGDAREA